MFQLSTELSFLLNFNKFQSLILIQPLLVQNQLTDHLHEPFPIPGIHQSLLNFPAGIAGNRLRRKDQDRFFKRGGKLRTDRRRGAENRLIPGFFGKGSVYNLDVFNDKLTRLMTDAVNLILGLRIKRVTLQDSDFHCGLSSDSVFSV